MACGRGRERDYDDYDERFENRRRNRHFWNGYVWYEVDVEFYGPYFEERRRPEPRRDDDRYDGYDRRRRCSRCGRYGCGCCCCCWCR